jgi:radical S-adenosyl methionine domain-containing protein 2
MTSACNYRCKFCCMQKLTGDLTSMKRAGDVLHHLKLLGIEKINFVGGEPLCNSLIFEVARLAKEMGFVVGITSNGSLLTEKTLSLLSGSVDWIGLSIDSSSDEIEKKLGRGDGSHVRHCTKVSDIVLDLGIKLKINTTVTKLNYKEDMREFIRKITPDRWKVFQFLHVPGQNDDAVASLGITDGDFSWFRYINQDIQLRCGASPVFESADCMFDSYLMLTPSGSIFLNTEFPFREYPIESVNADMLPKILNVENYFSRGAVYAW